MEASDDTKIIIFLDDTEKKKDGEKDRERKGKEEEGEG